MGVEGEMEEDRLEKAHDEYLVELSFSPNPLTVSLGRHIPGLILTVLTMNVIRFSLISTSS